jgi:glycerol-3-phosphate dehydrogenase
MATGRDLYDLAVIGGGINGAGVACDAAGRGLSVVLLEAGDLAGATSSASSKLIHGGLRYLEQRQFRLVREALHEREVLLAKAPHLVRPLRFVLPHVAGLRPRWMIRLGLFLYDHLARRTTIPGSGAVDLGRDAAGRPLRRDLRHGFTYWDCQVDDSRLVVLNARAAADKGADIRTRTRLLDASAEDGLWRLRIRDEAAGRSGELRARALVNAAGPWADRVLQSAGAAAADRIARLRLVKGSHIVVPRIAGADDGYILQQADRRVVFVLPFEEEFSLVGTTDTPFAGDPADVQADSGETDYLLAAVNRFFRAPLEPSDIVWAYAGVRPLFDDEVEAPSAVTRDYRLLLSHGADGPPLLSVLGGKITTYRRLAEEALDRLAPFFPKMGPPWTAQAPLPGGDLPEGGFDALLVRLGHCYPTLDPALLAQLARRHGTLADDILGDAGSPDDLGARFGAGLHEREVAFMRDREWARHPDDILWRRTKAGLHMTEAERRRAADAIEKLL